MAVSPVNRERYRSVMIAREVKWIFAMVPERVLRWGVGWLWRWLFTGPDGRPHRAAEIVLADLRRFARLERATIFDPDPAVMAYREGKRAAVLRIFHYLNLDEEAVQNLMELDDGFE